MGAATKGQDRAAEKRQYYLKHKDAILAVQARYRLANRALINEKQNAKQSAKRQRKKNRREKARQRWVRNTAALNTKRRERYATYKIRRKVLRESARYAALIKVNPPRPSPAILNIAFLSTLASENRVVA